MIFRQPAVVIDLILAAMSRVLKVVLPLLNAWPPTSRLCDIFLQRWMILCFFLVLTTCPLAVWARTTNKRCFRLFFKASATSSDSNHFTLRRSSFRFSNSLRKRPASLEVFVAPSSLTETRRANCGFQAPMSQTLTAIVHPLGSNAIPPVGPHIWYRDILPYRLQARQMGSTPQIWNQDAWIQKRDQDFPPLGSPKDQTLPSLKQLQSSSPPKARQWDSNPSLLGPQAFRIKNKHKKPKYRLPTPLSTPTVPDRSADTRVKQPYEAFLLLDVEGTCELGTNFNYPNEIIVSDHLVRCGSPAFSPSKLTGVPCMFASMGRQVRGSGQRIESRQ